MIEREQLLNDLKAIISNKDGEEFDNYNCNFSDYKNDDEIFNLLGQIFECDWHKSHEDLALLFQFSKNPIVTDALYKVACSNFEYLAWDENLPLQRKCTWALADIGTNQAKDYLEKLSEFDNELIASFAIKRLDNWEKELKRKNR